MATTPKTVRTYTLDGTKKDFTIPFEYLARKFVVVTLIGATRRELILNTEYRFTTNTTITTTKAWGPADNFDLIEIRRLTSATERLVDFADGSILRAYDLNISQVQSLHIAEEARDLTADTIGVNNDGDLDARARKIVNLADGVNDGDAVNLRQQKQWAGSALNSANASAASAQASQAQADRSQAQANASSASASASLTYSQNSQNSATNAFTSESNSLNYAQASQTARDLSQAWASRAEDSVVASGLYSSYHYSRKSAASASASQTSASNSANSASFSTTEANRATTQADRAKTEADKLANFNGLAGAIDSVSGNNVNWKGDQVSLSGKHISRSDVEANFTFAKADGSDTIRLVRTADRVVHLYDDAGGDRFQFGPTANVIVKNTTFNGELVANGGAVFKGGLVNNTGNFVTKGGVVGVWATSSSANSHAWFYDQSGNTRGILYARPTGQMTMVAGSSDCAQFFPDGRSAFNQITTGGIENQGRVASYRSGIGVNASMYANCHYMAQTDDGSPPAYGFHRGGSYALALYLAGSNLNMMDSGGTDRQLVHNANLMSWIASAMTANVLGCIASMYNQSGTNLGPDGAVVGSSLRYATHNNVGTTAGAGSWRCLCSGNNGGVGNYVRFA
ncbi:tail fiber protein [Xanthomonas phage Laurelin]|nr:tail fiber protein [Xanthomonas phage Laurelin]